MLCEHHITTVFTNHYLIVPLLLSGCGGQAPASSGSGKLEGTLTISGAWALYPMMTRWAEEFQKLHPDVQFDVSAGGAGKGMADALGGAVDIGMVSRDITPEEEAKGAYWVAVTKDAVFPMVNANNPVLSDLLKVGVSRETFIGIYITGEITTWGQVIGRPEVTDAIHVFTRSDAAGAPETWAKFLGKKQEDLLGVGVFGDPGLLDAVIKDPLGIGFNTLATPTIMPAASWWLVAWRCRSMSTRTGRPTQMKFWIPRRKPSRWSPQASIRHHPRAPKTWSLKASPPGWCRHLSNGSSPMGRRLWVRLAM